jgi:hypothetical protein
VSVWAGENSVRPYLTARLPFTTGSDPLYMALVPVTLVGFQALLYTANVQDGMISAFTA